MSYPSPEISPKHQDSNKDFKMNFQDPKTTEFQMTDPFGDDLSDQIPSQKIISPASKDPPSKKQVGSSGSKVGGSNSNNSKTPPNPSPTSQAKPSYFRRQSSKYFDESGRNLHQSDRNIMESIRNVEESVKNLQISDRNMERFSIQESIKRVSRPEIPEMPEIQTRELRESDPCLSESFKDHPSKQSVGLDHNSKKSIGFEKQNKKPVREYNGSDPYIDESSKNIHTHLKIDEEDEKSFHTELAVDPGRVQTVLILKHSTKMKIRQCFYELRAIQDNHSYVPLQRIESTNMLTEYDAPSLRFLDNLTLNIESVIETDFHENKSHKNLRSRNNTMTDNMISFDDLQTRRDTRRQSELDRMVKVNEMIHPVLQKAEAYLNKKPIELSYLKDPLLNDQSIDSHEEDIKRRNASDADSMDDNINDTMMFSMGPKKKNFAAVTTSQVGKPKQRTEVSKSVFLSKIPKFDGKTKNKISDSQRTEDESLNQDSFATDAKESIFATTTFNKGKGRGRRESADASKLKNTLNDHSNPYPLPKRVSKPKAPEEIIKEEEEDKNSDKEVLANSGVKPKGLVKRDSIDASKLKNVLNKIDGNFDSRNEAKANEFEHEVLHKNDPFYKEKKIQKTSLLAPNLMSNATNNDIHNLALQRKRQSKKLDEAPGAVVEEGSQDDEDSDSQDSGKKYSEFGDPESPEIKRNKLLMHRDSKISSEYGSNGLDLKALVKKGDQFMQNDDDREVDFRLDESGSEKPLSKNKNSPIDGHFKKIHEHHESSDHSGHEDAVEFTPEVFKQVSNNHIKAIQKKKVNLLNEDRVDLSLRFNEFPTLPSSDNIKASQRSQNHNHHNEESLDEEEVKKMSQYYQNQLKIPSRRNYADDDDQPPTPFLNNFGTFNPKGTFANTFNTSAMTSAFEQEKSVKNFQSIGGPRNKQLRKPDGLQQLIITSEKVIRRFMKVFFSRIKPKIDYDKIFPYEELDYTVQKLKLQKMIDGFAALNRHRLIRNSATDKILDVLLRYRRFRVVKDIKSLVSFARQKPILAKLKIFTTKVFYTVLSRFKLTMFDAFIKVTYDRKSQMKKYKGGDIALRFIKNKSQNKNVFHADEPQNTQENNFFDFKQIVDDPAEFFRLQQQKSKKNFQKSEYLTEDQIHLNSIQMQNENGSQTKIFPRRFSSINSSTPVPEKLLNHPNFRNKIEISEGKTETYANKNSLLSKFTSEAPGYYNGSQANIGVSYISTNMLNNLAAEMENIANLANDMGFPRQVSEQDPINKPKSSSHGLFQTVGNPSARKNTNHIHFEKNSLPIKSPNRMLKAEIKIESEASQRSFQNHIIVDNKSTSDMNSMRSKDENLMVKPETMNNLLQTLDKLTENLSSGTHLLGRKQGSGVSLNEPVLNSTYSQQEADLQPVSNIVSDASNKNKINQAAQIVLMLHYLFTSKIKQSERWFVNRLQYSDPEANKAKVFFLRLISKSMISIVARCSTFQKKKIFYVSDIVLTINRNYRKLVKRTFTGLKNGYFDDIYRGTYSVAHETEKMSEDVTDFQLDLFSPRISRPTGQGTEDRENEDVEEEFIEEEEDDEQNEFEEQNDIEDDFYMNLEEEYNLNVQKSTDLTHIAH